MKILKTAICIILLVSAPLDLFAEAIFLKSGEIIEGKIVSESDTRYSVTVGRQTKEIARADVIRVLYNEDYKLKQYIYTEDGKEIIGHIVAEDRNSYTVRKELTGPEEITISKKDIAGILRRPMPEKTADTDIEQIPAKKTGPVLSLGLYFKGILDRSLTMSDDNIEFDTGYAQRALGIVADISSEWILIRGALLLDFGQYEGDNLLGYSESTAGGGFEILTTLGFAFYRKNDFKFWAGPQLGLFVTNHEYDDGMWEITTVLLGMGGVLGFDYYPSDSVALIFELGLGVVLGFAEVESSLVEDASIGLTVWGSNPYIALGAMYRF